MSIIKRIYKHFIIGDIKNTETVPDVNEWYQYLDSLPQPEDEIDRSYNKYLCRKWYLTRSKGFVLNMAAFVRLAGAIPELLKRKKSLSKATEDTLVLVKANDVSLDDVVPDELIDRFECVKAIDRPNYQIGNICEEASRLFHECVKRHPFSFYYQLMILKELSLHTKILSQNNAKAVALYVEERNLASPLLRKMYEGSSREFDSFMHGEYLFQLIQAYMDFSRYYVWADSYKEMFEQYLYCSFGKCITYTPAKYSNKIISKKNTYSNYLTYYFSGESERTIRALSEVYKKMDQKGFSCKVRPHPRYSNYNLIKKFFSKNQIQDPNKINIDDSLSESQYIVGLNSTVLIEAKYAGCNVVLDDVTDVNEYLDFCKRSFRIKNKESLLLSTLLKNQGII